MDSPSLPPELSKSILEWDESDVHLFLSHLGFNQYEARLRGLSFRFSSLAFTQSYLS